LDLSTELRRVEIHMRFTARQHALVEELMHLHDSHERLSAVVDRAKREPRFSSQERTEAHRVAGCASSVWLIGEFRDAHCYFRSDAESPVVRGLVALLTNFFSGATPEEILGTEANPLQTLELERSLSATRRHGLGAVRQAIRNFASAARAGGAV
jgi:cysteine desulfuration protein SufE